jgi:hypothetical protein
MVDKVEFTFPDEQEEKNVTEPVDNSNQPELEVVDDTPEEDRGRKPLEKEVVEPTEEELAAYSDKVKARISELTHARHDERRRREQLEREYQEAMRAAQALAEENRRIQQQLAQTTTTSASHYKELAQARLDRAKAKLRAAHEAGDTDTFVEAQQEVAAAVLDVERAKYVSQPPLQSQSFSGNVPSNAPERQPATPQTQVTVDPRASSWRESNPWFGQDPEMTAFALGVHNRLVQSGVNPASEEYYSALNKRIREVFPSAFKDTTTPSKPAPSTVVAPVTRSSAPKKIVLTKSQVAVANRLGVPLEMYARQVAALKEQENAR